MLKLFRKRQNVFLQLIHNQALTTLKGMDALVAYMNTPDVETAKALTAAEKEADEYRRILINELNKTFITPFDREDIFSLSRAIDDVLDYAYSTLSEMETLKVKPTPYMARIAVLLRDGANELLMAVDNIREHSEVATEHMRRAKQMENKVEDIYREALAEMFNNCEEVKHVVKALKHREVYRHLSNAADRGDEAANVIADIIVKIT